jgi:hypothetical protein
MNYTARTQPLQTKYMPDPVAFATNGNINSTRAAQALSP